MLPAGVLWVFSELMWPRRGSRGAGVEQAVNHKKKSVAQRGAIFIRPGFLRAEWYPLVISVYDASTLFSRSSDVE